MVLETHLATQYCHVGLEVNNRTKVLPLSRGRSNRSCPKYEMCFFTSIGADEACDVSKKNS